MRKITILAISSILCMLLCCCATTVNTVPDWVFGKQDYETSGKYLLAVGSGRSRDAAEKDARQNLASFFGANINSQSYFGSTYYEKGGTAQTSQVYNSDLLIDVKVDDLAGIEEIDSFLDSDGVFYVLLGMNKRDSISYYSSKLTDLNKEIGFEYETLEFATHNLENLISLANLKKKIQKATEISEIIGLIDSSRSITVSVPLSLIERLRQAYINDIPFSFELNENADSIATSVEKVITDNGFHVSLDQTANVVVLTLALNNVTGNSKNAFCGYDFSIEIKDVSIGKSFYSWKKQGREAMSTYEQAQARVIYNLSKEIEKEFNEAFMENF